MAKASKIQSVGVRELRQDASRILKKVEDGSVFEVTNHGVAVARLIPIQHSTYESLLEAGLISPSSGSSALKSGKLIKLPGKRPATDALKKIREEESF